MEKKLFLTITLFTFTLLSTDLVIAQKSTIPTSSFNLIVTFAISVIQAVLLIFLIVKIKGGKSSFGGLLILNVVVQFINILYWNFLITIPTIANNPILSYRLPYSLSGIYLGINTAIAWILSTLLNMSLISFEKVIKHKRSMISTKRKMTFKEGAILSLWNVVIFPLLIVFMINFFLK